MKARILRVLFAMPVLLMLGAMTTFADPKGETVTLKGEVVDLWCYLEAGDHGAEHKKCALMCANAGNPIGLVTEQGDIYVMLGMEDHQPGKDVLISKMADTVTVEGTLVKKGGTQVVYVSAVK